MNDNKFSGRTNQDNNANGEDLKPPTFYPARAPRSPRRRLSNLNDERAANARAVEAVEAVSAHTIKNPQKSAHPRNSDVRQKSGASKSRRKFPLRKVIALVVVLLLVLAGVAIFWAVDTYNSLKSSVIRTSALSLTKDNSPASTFLIVGNDGRSPEAQSDVEGARADTIMLLIHTENKDSLISIPRDAMVEIPPFMDKRGIFAQPGEEVEKIWAKINAAYSYGGPKLLVETVEQLVGLKVDHYAEVGFEGAAALTDALGGINLCYDQEVNDPDSGMVWTPGCKDVNGAEALAYSRMRYQDPLSDIGRTLRQRTVVQKLAAKSTDLLTSGNLFNLWNVFKLKEVARTVLGTIIFDETTSLADMYNFINYFKRATSPSGYMDILPIEDPDHYNQVLGLVVKVDPENVKSFITQLAQK